MRLARVGCVSAMVVALVAVAMPEDAEAGLLDRARSLAQRAKKRATRWAQGVKRGVKRAKKRVAGWAGGAKKRLGSALKKVVDWGRKAIEWTKKKVANLGKLRKMFSRKGAARFFRRVLRSGKVKLKRLMRSARNRLGKPRVTRDLPAFLKRLQAWRARRAQGGAR